MHYTYAWPQQVHMVSAVAVGGGQYVEGCKALIEGNGKIFYYFTVNIVLCQLFVTFYHFQARLSLRFSSILENWV